MKNLLITHILLWTLTFLFPPFIQAKETASVNETEKSKAEEVEKDKARWKARLLKMRLAFTRVKKFQRRSISPDRKISVLKRFIKDFKEDNPYSEKDNDIRRKVRVLIKSYSLLESSSSADDLESETEKKEEEKDKAEWEARLTKMTLAFTRVKNLQRRSVSIDRKISALNMFIEDFKEDNPHSRKDNLLRQKARAFIVSYSKNGAQGHRTSARRYDNPDFGQLSFPHRAHQLRSLARFKGNREKACRRCHHKKREGQDPRSCSVCHAGKKVKSKGGSELRPFIKIREGKLLTKKDVLHALCKGCHIAVRERNAILRNQQKRAPVVCNGCHRPPRARR